MILLGCSHSVTKSDAQNTLSTPENLILFLRDNDHFDIYLESDILSFYLEPNKEKGDEYTYDIYRIKDRVKSGRFVYGLNFEDSDTLNLYFDCTSISLPKEVCNKCMCFVKDLKSGFYHKYQ